MILEIEGGTLDQSEKLYGVVVVPTIIKPGEILQLVLHRLTELSPCNRIGILQTVTHRGDAVGVL